ncbi:MAG TPA: MerR family transcriptional regulator [Streptosporangiaceae bacterium]
MESLDTALMSIGRFARLTGLTVKALRHYDELGLLRPAAVDAETGYRSYSSAQLGRAEAIRLLRRLEVPLDDIATLVETDDPAAVRGVLLDHQRRTALRSAELNVVLQGLQPLLDGKEPVMGTHAEALDRETQRRLAADCFNKTWTLLEKERRTREDDDEMLHCAHASAYHWSQVGTVANRARGEWQCSRVYAVLGRPEAAISHAQKVLEICQREGIADFDLAFAYEALARASAAGGDADEARRWAEQARAACAEIADGGDRELVLSDLETLPAGI